jgi:hypothetical protein
MVIGVGIALQHLSTKVTLLGFAIAVGIAASAPTLLRAPGETVQFSG